MQFLPQRCLLVIAMDNNTAKKNMHFTNSTLKFKVPPYSNISCARCNDQLLEGDHKLHFEYC